MITSAGSWKKVIDEQEITLIILHTSDLWGEAVGQAASPHRRPLI